MNKYEEVGHTGKTEISGKLVRRNYQYQLTAAKLNLPLEEYLSKGKQGYRYCSKCLTWRKRTFFHEYLHTKNFYSGICKRCTPGLSAPKGIDPRIWGAAVRSSVITGLTPKEYIKKREDGFRWCFEHKGWFDASNMIREGGPRISKCKACNARRAADGRASRKAKRERASISV